MNKPKTSARPTAQQIHSVPMPVAASLVYYQLSRDTQSPLQRRQYDRFLNDAATALSYLADVYYQNDGRGILRLSAAELARGRFEQGARAFRVRDGRVYRKLSVRRMELVDAISVFKTSHAALVFARVVSRSAAES